MKVTRMSETTPGPAEWFTGAVFLDTAAAPGNGARTEAEGWRQVEAGLDALLGRLGTQAE